MSDTENQPQQPEPTFGPLSGEMVEQLIESIQEKIDRAVASRDRAESSRRIQAGIDIGQAGNQ